MAGPVRTLLAVPRTRLIDVRYLHGSTPAAPSSRVESGFDAVGCACVSISTGRLRLRLHRGSSPASTRSAAPASLSPRVDSGYAFIAGRVRLRRGRLRLRLALHYVAPTRSLPASLAGTTALGKGMVP